MLRDQAGASTGTSSRSSEERPSNGGLLPTGTWILLTAMSPRRLRSLTMKAAKSANRSTGGLDATRDSPPPSGVFIAGLQFATSCRRSCGVPRGASNRHPTADLDCRVTLLGRCRQRRIGADALFVGRRDRLQQTSLDCGSTTMLRLRGRGHAVRQHRGDCDYHRSDMNDVQRMPVASLIISPTNSGVLPLPAVAQLTLAALGILPTQQTPSYCLPGCSDEPQ